DRVQHFDWQLRELPVVSPFSFSIYASKIKETMMLEDPTVAVERIYRELYARVRQIRSEEHTSELQSLAYIVCRLLLEKKNTKILFTGRQRYFNTTTRTSTPSTPTNTTTVTPSLVLHINLQPSDARTRSSY